MIFPNLWDLQAEILFPVHEILLFSRVLVVLVLGVMVPKIYRDFLIQTYQMGDGRKEKDMVEVHLLADRCSHIQYPSP